MSRLLSVTALLAFVLMSMPAASAQTPASALAGRWTGAVKAEMGEMPIEVSLKVDGEAITGEIKTFHGVFKINKGEQQKDGRWKLSFVTDDGAAGSLTGAVKGDAFSGDWDFRPNAVGTFALTRVK